MELLLDPQKWRALRDFYREEFVRHIDHLTSAGLFDQRSRKDFDSSYRRFLASLERVCASSDISHVAEVMLQRFDTLSRLSEIEERRGH